MFSAQIRFDRPRQYFRVKEMGRKNPKAGDGKLARMIQREFASIHKRFDETASKQDLAPLREDLGILRRDTEEGLRAVTGSLKAIQEELKDLKGMDAELTALRLRVARVERKVGLTR
jgi:hypothetical protein